MTAPHIERMIVERDELADRLLKLTQFISGSPIFTQLPADEKELMREQRIHMDSYHDVLETRIDLAQRSA